MVMMVSYGLSLIIMLTMLKTIIEVIDYGLNYFPCLTMVTLFNHK